MTGWAGLVIACVLALTATACEGATREAAGRSQTASGNATTTAEPPSRTSASRGTPSSAAEPFDEAAALDVVRELAALGPREATSAAFRAAAGRVEAGFLASGYVIHRMGFHVPAGVSWGVPVDAGRSFNVVARPADFDGEQPHVVIGAHLDTVPQSPGAEDNASGIAVMLELARLAADGAAVPVVFVAFGAEEPRGPGDDEHHFGSRTYARGMTATDRDALVGMVSLDRVGGPGPVRVCTGGLSPPRVQSQLLAAAERTGVRAVACKNRTSDHWPFEKAGHTVARIGGNPSAGYHSARDLPRTIDPRQLTRSAAVVWEWLRP